MNDEGAEAAAASGVKEVFCSVSPKFNVDHPFLFFIVSETGYPVFIGHVAKPETVICLLSVKLSDNFDYTFNTPT